MNYDQRQISRWFTSFQICSYINVWNVTLLCWEYNELSRNDFDCKERFNTVFSLLYVHCVFISGEICISVLELNKNIAALCFRNMILKFSSGRCMLFLWRETKHHNFFFALKKKKAAYTLYCPLVWCHEDWFVCH